MRKRDIQIIEYREISKELTLVFAKPSKYKKIFGKVLIVYGVLTFPLPTGSQLAILYGLKLIGITKKDITKLYRLIKYSLKQKKRLSTLKTLIF